MKISCETLMALCLAFASPAGAQQEMLDFTTADSHVQVQSVPGLMPASGLTVEAWCWFDPSPAWGGCNPTVVRKDPGTHPYILRTSSGFGGVWQWFVWSQTGANSPITSGVPVPVQAWHHVAGTYDGNFVRLFLDGVEVASTPRTGPLLVTSGPLLIGRGNATDETWKGNLEEVRIWSYARSGTEIQSTMSHQIGGQAGLVAVWHFNGDYMDSVGIHHGTPMGSVGRVPSTAPLNPLIFSAPGVVAFGSSVTFSMGGLPALAPYVMDVSVTGTTPGIPVPGTPWVVPLNQPLLNFQFGAALPGVFNGFVGSANSLGGASADLVLPPDPNTVGVTVNAALAHIDFASPGGVAAVSLPTATLVTTPPPTITSVSPSTSPVSGGRPVVISGTDLAGATSVTFGGFPATAISVVDPETITCVTPAGNLGFQPVQVASSAGVATGWGLFEYVPDIQVASVSPLSATAGVPVTISGSGYPQGVSVSVGPIVASIVSVTPNSIIFTMPAGAPCNASLVVAAPNGQTVSVPFNPAPNIAQVINGSGPAAGGGVFFIAGSGFTAGTTVSVGGSPANVLSSSPLKLQVQAPPGPIGPSPIVVTAPNGCTASSTYTYQ